MAIKIYAFLLLSLCLSLDAHFIVHPNSCSADDDCLTLNDCANDSIKYLTSNTTLVVLNGSHYLYLKLTLKNISNLTLQGESSISRIILQREAYILCINSARITLKSIKFIRQGFASSSLEIIYSISVSLIDIAIRSYSEFNRTYSRGIKFVSSNVKCFNCRICDGFTYNNGGAVYANGSYVIFHGNNSFELNRANSGGAFFISNSTFIWNGCSSFKSNGAYSGAGGAIYAEDSLIKFLGNNIFYKNQATFYGFNVFFWSTGGAVVAIRSTLILRNETLLLENAADYGGAAYLKNSKCIICGHTRISSNSAHNKGGALYAINTSFHIHDEMIMFNNSASQGGGIFATETVAYFSGAMSITHNTAHSEGGGMFLQKSSKISILGDFQMIGNEAKQGGGLHLESSTSDDYRSGFSMTLKSPVNLLISKNKATNEGGGIYIRDELYDSSVCNDVYLVDNCPFKVAEKHSVISWVFEDNTARNTGSDMFGGNLNNCYTVFNFSWLPSRQLFRKLNFGNFVNNQTKITSIPMKVCICDQYIQDCNQQIALFVHRGQMIKITLLVAGVLNLPVESKIDYIITPKSSQTLLKYFAEGDTTGCRHTTFQLLTEQEKVQVSLFPKKCDSNTATLEITLSVRNCPSGFVFNRNTCDCDKNLERITGYTELCQVETGLIKQPGIDWIQSQLENNSYMGFIWSPNCPKEFCSTENKNKFTWLNFSSNQDADKLCIEHRTGIMCGACKPNYSLILNSLKCSRCHNDNHLSLIIIFILSGIALIAILLSLHMTVATGTLNGIIFYSNIVNIYNKVLFPSHEIEVNLLTIFVSWTNLDLGISTCFYRGLNAYSYTWLQFAFPFYLWLLVGMIILVCKYSRKAVKLLGSNPVAVLATVVLMSYTKLLHTSQEALSYVKLTYSDNRTVYAWRADPNVEYFRGKHVILAVAAVCVIAFLHVPYITILLIGYHLQGFSDKKYFRWVNQFKPLLDTYYAPYTPTMRFWTGFLLIVRTCLSICYSIVRDNDGDITLTILSSLLSTIVFIPWVTCKIYEKRILNFLEATFTLNLIILAIVTHQVKQVEDYQVNVSYISTGIVLAEFLAVIAYHIHVSFKRLSCCINILEKISIKIFPTLNLFQPAARPNMLNTEPAVLATFTDMREPLLEDSTI